MYPNRYQKMFEIQDIEKIETFDCVDELKVVEKDGVDTLIDMNDYPEHE